MSSKAELKDSGRALPGIPQVENNHRKENVSSRGTEKSPGFAELPASRGESFRDVMHISVLQLLSVLLLQEVTPSKSKEDFGEIVTSVCHGFPFWVSGGVCVRP